MLSAFLRTPADPGEAARVVGPARLGRRTKELVGRLERGDVAVVAHRDLDRLSGEELVRCGVRAVVNAEPFSSGAYPNAGPLVLAQAGVALLECPDADPFALLGDGDRVELRGGALLRSGVRVAVGRALAPAEVLARRERLRARVDDALAAFARNTVERLAEERELATGPLAFPPLDTEFRDRPALVVARGPGHRSDLRALGPYVRAHAPVIVAVDGGAEAVREEGWVPDVIVGDMDSASDASLRSGAELVVHAYRDGRAPGRARLAALGLGYKVVVAPGTSEDVAMLLAAEGGAELVVAVAAPFDLVAFLDKGRPGMASTFLTRLRLGEKLVDANGVARLGLA